jgi:hypothetical protein
MARTIFVKSGGDTKLPIADGTLETDLLEKNLSLSDEGGMFVIAFYDVAGDIVTPTAGTIAAEMSPIKGQWQGPSSGDASINASLTGPSATYTMPRFDGPAAQGRLTFSGIAGAGVDHAIAYFWRF